MSYNDTELTHFSVPTSYTLHYTKKTQLRSCFYFYKILDNYIVMISQDQNMNNRDKNESITF